MRFISTRYKVELLPGMPLVRSFSGELICEVLKAINSTPTVNLPENAGKTSTIDPIDVNASKDSTIKMIKPCVLVNRSTDNIKNGLTTPFHENSEKMKIVKKGHKTSGVAKERSFFREKDMMYILSIQNARKEKETRSLKQKKRLKRRVQLLKQKYLEVQKINVFSSLRSIKSNHSDANCNEKKKTSNTAILRSSLSDNNKNFFAKQNDDYGKWKKKQGVKIGQQVFCMTGWYPSVSYDLYSETKKISLV